MHLMAARVLVFLDSITPQAALRLGAQENCCIEMRGHKPSEAVLCTPIEAISNGAWTTSVEQVGHFVRPVCSL